MTSGFHTRGNYAPVLDEVVLGPLDVIGRLPDDLCGRYVRNGPNPVSGDARFWFSGDGMLHGVDLRGGRAVAYRNRWVRTPWLTDATVPKCSDDGTPDLALSLANTNVIRFAGRTLALEENSLPYEVDADLATVGPFDFGGRLATAMTAHPKECPATGELHFIGYAAAEPYLTYHVAAADGRLVHTAPVRVPGPTMIHDVGLSRRHVVLLDLPVVMDRMTRRQPSFRWSDIYGARLGVMPRHGVDAEVVWLDIEPCYIFHLVNCWEQPDGTLVVDAARLPDLWREPSARFAPPAVWWRYEIDIVGRTVRERQLDDRVVEFPRIDDRLLGEPARWAYLAGTASSNAGTVVRYDLLHGTEPITYDFGAGCVVGEPLVVPRVASTAEDDSWVLTFVYDAQRNASDLAVLAADDLGAGPVARVRLPRRVPFGFHGNWIEDRR